MAKAILAAWGSLTRIRSGTGDAISLSGVEAVGNDPLTGAAVEERTVGVLRGPDPTPPATGRRQAVAAPEARHVAQRVAVEAAFSTTV